MSIINYFIDYFPGLRSLVVNFQRDIRAIVFTVIAVVVVYATSLYFGIPVALWFFVFIVASIFCGINELKEKQNSMDDKLQKILSLQEGIETNNNQPTNTV